MSNGNIRISNLVTDIITSAVSSQSPITVTLYDLVDHEKLTIEVYPVSSKITITREGM